MNHYSPCRRPCSVVASVLVWLALCSTCRAAEPTAAPKASGSERPLAAAAPTKVAQVEEMPVMAEPDPAWLTDEAPLYFDPDTGVAPYAGAVYPQTDAATAWWVQLDYLHWATKGMWLPPLVTTSPDDVVPQEAGVLGFPDTEILLGNESVLDDPRSGGRIRLGHWLGPARRLGLQVEYFQLASLSDEFSFSSDSGGEPILARPFFNINPRNDRTGAFDPPAREDSELVSSPDLLAGTVSVSADTNLQSGSLLLLWNACCISGDPCSACCTGNCNECRVDLLGGYRIVYLEDNLTIREDLTSLETANPGGFDIYDSFRTSNRFHGPEIGLLLSWRRNRWSVESLLKLALGTTEQSVTIDGGTQFVSTGGQVSESYSGGLLAQRTNIGHYSRDVFSAIPELGLTLGFQVTPRLRATLGYSFIYWSRVARPGEQIDLDVNPDLLPPERVPFQGALRPSFVFHDTDFWAQGVNAGLDFRW